MKVNLSNVEKPDYELASPGIYTGEFVEAEERTTKNGDPMVSYRFDITGAERPENESHVGKPVFLNCMLEGHEKAVQIAMSNLRGIAEALDAGEEPDVLQDFLFKPLRVKVGIAKSKDPQYDDQNSLKAFYPLETEDQEPAKKPGGLSTRRRRSL